MLLKRIEGTPEGEKHYYEIKISGFLNGLTQPGFVSNNQFGGFGVSEANVETYERFSEDIARFLAEHPGSAAAILENVWCWPDIPCEQMKVPERIPNA